MESQWRNRANQNSSSFFEQCFNCNRYGHKSNECKSMVNRRNIDPMLVEDLDILLINAGQGEIKVILGLIRETTLFVVLATNLVTLQNFAEARI